MRVLLSIPSLLPGGAERQFAELAAGLAARGHAVLAVALERGGPLESALGGAQLAVLGKTCRLDNVRVAWKLAGLLRSFRPQAHYTFLTAACVLGGLLKPFFPAVKLVMGLRATDVEHAAYSYGRAGRLMHGLEARLSSMAELVVANSHAGRQDALRRGFSADRTVVVPNGIDTARCRPDRVLGLPLREAWGIQPGELLVGHVARLDPMKDHPNFLRAAALLATQRPGLHFVCVGAGPEGYAAELRSLADGLGLADRLVWTGGRTDMPAVYNALDALCLSSAYGEGFPNVLGEAMACGVPCCATDVGDAAQVIGDMGGVEPKSNPEALAAGLEGLLDRLGREGGGLRSACRERIVANFGVERMVEDTEARLEKLCAEPWP
ncbi:MAG: glycosyltransferase [Humidesulfovibrio sp.]|uniref:glycosyltransferase n=1 Tax=Humidesulfovibrio sp. TaxID=2910988 RepID=UPI0027E6824B|nr:glycosyltransferase [Humidesulfovibrio sp.]MDQ7834276.1 glycosyltransferase [Humidesulfovibrio sp.]